MKNIISIFLLLFLSLTSRAQYEEQLSPKVIVATSTNIETYFFAEKLAVERIGNYVFDIKGVNYSHQPMVYFGFRHFRKYQDNPIVVRIGELLKALRDSLYDNGPILDHLVNQQDFPAIGLRYAGSKPNLIKNSMN